MKTSLLICVIVASFGLLPRAYGQGALTPPGPPGPTMLTLSQVEPRTPVDATHTPGDSVVEFIISSPGSYYLTTNIVGVSGKHGIDVFGPNNVTLDLNGFSVIGVTGALTGIIIPGGANVVVRNGIVTGWTNGIASYGNNVTLQGLTVTSNALYGIQIEGNNSSVIGNNVAGNNASDTTGAGIYVAIAATNNLIQNNHVVSTVGGTSSAGIFASGTGTIVIQNFVQGNGANDIEWGSSAIIGQYINTTSGNIVTNMNPWGNFEY